MERHFDADLSTVRLHERSALGNHGILAVARGEDITFAPGLVRPGNTGSQHPIAHELAHVLQQRAGALKGRSGLAIDATLESEAEQWAQPLGESRAQSSVLPGAPLLGNAAIAQSAPGIGPVQPMMKFLRRVSGNPSRRSYSSGRGGGGGGDDPRKPWKGSKSSHEADTTSSALEKIRLKMELLARARENRERLVKAHGKDLNSSFRFMNIHKEEDYQSPVEREHGKKAQETTLAAVKKYPDLEKQLRMGHETMKRYEESPFISTATDPMAAASSGTLDKITSVPPDLVHLSFPPGELHPAMSAHGQRETEHLAGVNNLWDRVVGISRNPIQGGIPRLSRLTPQMLAHMQQSEETQHRLDPGREVQQQARIDRMKRKLNKNKKKTDDE